MHERDESGHWLAGLSEPMLSLRTFLTAHDDMQRRQARTMGINATDMQALRLLDLHGPLGPTELGRRLGLRSASVTVLLDRLEASGYVERVRLQLHRIFHRKPAIVKHPKQHEENNNTSGKSQQ